MKKPQISYSREQYLAEIAKDKKARKPKLPSKWGRLIAAGSEDEQQALFFEWVDEHKEKHPALDRIFAVPNGSNKSIAQRIVMKITGLRPGVPDVCVPIANVHYIGLWIEFKRPGGGTVSLEQGLWHRKLAASGHDVRVYDSAMEAIARVIQYLNLDMSA